MKTSTTTMFSAEVEERRCSTVASGITRRGNWVLRTMPSWATTDVTACEVASWKKPNRTMLSSSRTG